MLASRIPWVTSRRRGDHRQERRYPFPSAECTPRNASEGGGGVPFRDPRGKKGLDRPISCDEPGKVVGVRPVWPAPMLATLRGVAARPPCPGGRAGRTGPS